MISMFGIALGVAALIIVLSVMNGFQKEVRDRMLSVLSHIEVFDAAGSMPDWKNTALQAQKNSSVCQCAVCRWAGDDYPRRCDARRDSAWRIA
jgi:lipoprotein-releasing system permease protein